MKLEENPLDLAMKPFFSHSLRVWTIIIELRFSLKEKVSYLKNAKPNNKRRCLVILRDSFPPNETEISQEEKRQLQEEYKKAEKDERQCVAYMAATFAFQRLTIDTFGPVKCKN